MAKLNYEKAKKQKVAKEKPHFDIDPDHPTPNWKYEKWKAKKAMQQAKWDRRSN